MATPTIALTSPGHARYQASEAGRHFEGISDPTYSAQTVDIALDPVAVERSEARDWGDDGHGHDGYWDWRTFHGEDCVLDSNGSCLYSWVTLPRVEVDDPSFTERGWRDTALDECAMRLDGTPAHGFVDPPGPATATVRAVVVDHNLFVEVTDDRWVTSGPVVDDLEVQWLSDFRGPVRLTPTRMVVVNATTRRWRFQTSSADIGVRYHDTDDGRSVQTLSSSTSPLYPSQVVRIGRGKGGCHVDHGQLAVVPRPASVPTVPLVVGQ